MADESIQQTYWWKAEKKDAHRSVFQTVDRICRQQAMLRERTCDFLDMYSNGNVAGLGPSASGGGSKWASYFFRRAGNEAPRFNVSCAISDTAVSMVAYNPPIPQYITTGAEFGTIRKAKKKTRVLQGQMHTLGSPLARRGFLDACKTGTGIVWGSIGDDGLPKLERVSMLEILVEHADGMYMQPLSIHRLHSCVSKEWLISRSPAELHRAIENAQSNTQRSLMNRFLAEGTEGWSSGSMCEMVESIHLPVGREPGRRTLCISSATLEDDPYTDTFFPIAVCRYRERDFGFYGAGLVEASYETQCRVDTLCERNAKSQNLGSTLKLFNPNGPGTLTEAELTNRVGEVWDVNGDKPIQVVTFNGTLDDLQQQINLELERLLFVEGISAAQAAGDGASAGLTSGVAIRAESDERAGRMARQIEMYQKFCLDMAKMIERLNDRVAAKKPSYVPQGVIKSGRATFLISSQWASLSIPKGQVQIEMFPMSALPNSPSGRYAAVMEWIQGGFADRQYGMQLLEFPDIDAYADQQLAYIDLVQWQLEQIIDEGKRTLPIPRQDLDIAIDLGQRSLCRAVTMPNVPPDVLENLDFYITKAEELREVARAKLAKQQAELAKQQADQQAAPTSPVQGAGGATGALAGAAPAVPGPGPRLVA